MPYKHDNQTLYSIGYFHIMTSSILDNIEIKIKKKLNKVLKTFENSIENGAFALIEQMPHFQYYFQKPDSSKASKGCYNGVKE